MTSYNSDYSGRQVDIEFMQSVLKPAPLIPLQLTWESGPVKMVTGMQKLVQRFAITLLTHLGSVNFAQTFGTTFVEDVTRGAGQNGGQLGTVVAFANEAVRGQLAQEDADTNTFGAIPDDERLVAAQLLSFSADYATGTIFLRIQLTNAQGDSYVYVLPVATTGS